MSFGTTEAHPRLFLCERGRKWNVYGSCTSVAEGGWAPIPRKKEAKNASLSRDFLLLRLHVPAYYPFNLFRLPRIDLRLLKRMSHSCTDVISL